MSFIQKSFFNVLLKLLLLGIQFVSYVQINRMLSLPVFGNYAILFTNALVFQMIFSLGTDVALVHFYSVKKFQALFSKIVWQYIGFAGLLLIIGIAGGYLFSVNILRLGIETSVLENKSALIVLYYACLLVNTMVQGFMLCRGQYLLNVSVQIGIYVCYILSLFFFKGMEAVVISFIIINILSIGVLFFSRANKQPIIFTDKIFSSGAFWKYALAVVVINCIQFLAYRADFWIVNHYLHSSDVAVYANAVKFAQLFWLVPKVIASISFREFSVGNKKLLQLLMSLTNAVFVGLLICGVIYFFAADWLVKLLLSDKYFAVGKLSIALLPGIIFFSYNMLLAPYFSTHNKIWINGLASLAMAVILIAGDLYFVPIYGLKAAVMLNNVAYSFGAAMLLIIYIYSAKLTWKEVFVFIPNIKLLKQISIG